MQKRFLNIKECSELTSISQKTLYKWCQERRIPFLQPGGKMLRFEIFEIQQWLAGARVVRIEGSAMTLTNNADVVRLTSESITGKGMSASERGDHE
jgi:excisionase family DNA binding protein